MGLAHVEDLDSLLHSKTGGDATAVKVALTRLSAEIKDRVKKSTPESADFFTSVVGSLGQLRGTAHAEGRMACLYDVSQFFQKNGFAAQALDAAHHLEHLATQTNAQRRRLNAASVIGMVHADLGNISESVISSTKVLYLSREIGDLVVEASGLSTLGPPPPYAGPFPHPLPFF